MSGSSSQGSGSPRSMSFQVGKVASFRLALRHKDWRTITSVTQATMLLGVYSTKNRLGLFAPCSHRFCHLDHRVIPPSLQGEDSWGEVAAISSCRCPVLTAHGLPPVL